MYLIVLMNNQININQLNLYDVIKGSNLFYLLINDVFGFNLIKELLSAAF